MDDKDQIEKNPMDDLKQLPEKAQRAIQWMVQNIDAVEQLTQGDKLTEEEIERFTRLAWEREDYLMLALIKYQQFKDREQSGQ